MDGVDSPRILNVSEFVSTPRLDEPRLDEPDLDEPDLDEPDLDEPDLDEPDLDEPDLDEPDLDVPGPNELRPDEPGPDPRYLDEPGPDSQDIGSAAIDVHDRLPAIVARYDPAASDRKNAEEGPITTRASTQAPKRYKCGIKRLDGSPCHATFTQKREVYQHQKTAAHMRSLPCPFCPAKPRQPITLLLHVQKLHPEKLWTDFRCRVCGVGGIFTMVGLAIHLRRYHGGLSLEQRYNATRGF
jgi:hypothetical protein